MNKVEVFRVHLSKFNDWDKDKFTNTWVLGWFSTRTKEQFDTDLSEVLNEIGK